MFGLSDLRLSDLNFKHKILLVGIITIIILTVSIIITMSNTVNSLFTDIIYKNQMVNVEKTTNFLSYWLTERKKSLKIYANNYVLKQGSWSKKTEYLEKELSNSQNNYYYFFIADNKGNYKTTFGEKRQGNISNRKYFSEIMQGKTVISRPITSKATGLPIIVIGTPLKENNKIKGILASVVRLNNISEYINEFNLKYPGAVSFIIDDKGQIISHPDNKLIFNQSISSLENHYHNNNDNDRKWSKEILNNHSGYYKCNTSNSLIFYNKISGPHNWKLVTQIPREYVNQPIKNINLKIVIIGLIAIILSSILINHIANTISQPVTKLRNIFKKGAQGNLTVRADIKSNDEVGEAAESFNQMMEAINDLTYNDPLTGLPNIEFFKQKLNIMIDHLDDINEPVYICGIGIDDFKTINDRFGHPAGDQILIELAEKLKNKLGTEANLARMGDEYYFTVPESNIVEDNILTYSREILECINQNYLINNNLIFVTTSMGIATYPDDGKTPNELVKSSSLAMHFVKKKTKDNISFYSPNIEENLSEKKRLERELSEALKNNQFTLYYQPLISSKDDNIIGLEALIRWKHPEKGLISPGVFIPLAEETGFIRQIGKWVLKEACRDLKSIHENYRRDIFVSVNVSPSQFMQKEFVKHVQQILINTGLDPEYLEVEITERTAMDNIKHTMAILKDLKKLGTKIAIDDFGTGYSSLSYLNQFALDTLKIDKSFIDQYPDDRDSHAIVDSIITIAHNLDLAVVAEGVETERQVKVLKEHACEYMQGYHFSRPLPLEDLLENEITKNID